MLEIKELSNYYSTSSSLFFKKKFIKAVENASLVIEKNQIVGLVGESGCGKSTLGRGILKLLPPVSGKIIYNGEDITSYSPSQMNPLRKKMQIIFQDPYSSLNPRMTIFEIILEGLLAHSKISNTEAMERVVSILQKVSLSEDILERYPHEFSGGQRQRIAIARALILNPEFLVCDEISSALDVSNQAQLVNLLLDFKNSSSISMLYISHDLNVVGYIADKIAVMYLGKIVEFGSKEVLVKNSKHPYTKILFSNVFELKNPKKKRELLQGEIPSAMNKPDGCYFHKRCPSAKGICSKEVPVYKEIEKDHSIACHFPI